MKENVLDLSAPGLLSAEVHFDAVVENGLDAKRHVPLDERLNSDRVLAGDELAVEGRLHELLEQCLPEKLAHELQELDRFEFEKMPF